MWRDPLDADNSQKYFKDDHLMELYTEAKLTYKPCLDGNPMTYAEVKRIVQSPHQQIENTLDAKAWQTIVDKKIGSAFHHCFFNSLEDARCAASMQIIMETMFITMPCLQTLSLYVLDDDKISIYLSNSYNYKLNIDFARKITLKSKLLFAIIRCTPTIDQLDFELNKAMRKLILYCIGELNKWSDKLIKNKELVDLSKYVLVDV